MQNNKFLGFTKDLNAQLCALCGLTAAEEKYLEKTSSTWAPRARGEKHRRIEVMNVTVRTAVI